MVTGVPLFQDSSLHIYIYISIYYDGDMMGVYIYMIYIYDIYIYMILRSYIINGSSLVFGVTTAAEKL